MTDLRGWGMSVPHLLPDAVVAYVDGELSASSHERASAHVAGCAFCAAEVAAQRQARSAVRSADAPSVPAGLLAALCNIPQHTELPAAPDNLAITEDGQLVAVQRPDRAALNPTVTPLGATAALGSSAPLGRGSAVLGQQRAKQRALPGRAAQGAGVVVSGLVLGALALVNPSGTGAQPESAPSSPNTVRPAVVGAANVTARFAGTSTGSHAQGASTRDARAS